MAGRLRDRTVIRIVAHMEEQQWLWPQVREQHGRQRFCILQLSAGALE